tara:strand:+ start:125 stop:832 length:708 start_codon:yes stop_codon:yes gene_type:complete
VKNNLQIIPIEMLEYSTGYKLQKNLHSQMLENSDINSLIILQHPHVYTLGRRADQNDILIDSKKLAKLKIQKHISNRGGEITYHGPGQLVIYPLINLKKLQISPIEYIRIIEEIIINTLSEISIDAARKNECPGGVWVNQKKIAAIGVRISRGITTHGFSLNVSTNLSYYKHIIPCGNPLETYTSISEILNKNIPITKIRNIIIKQICKKLNLKPKQVNIENFNKEHSITPIKLI